MTGKTDVVAMVTMKACHRLTPTPPLGRSGRPTHPFFCSATSRGAPAPRGNSWHPSLPATFAHRVKDEPFAGRGKPGPRLDDNPTRRLPAILRQTAYDLDGAHNRTLVTGTPDPGPYVGSYTMQGTDPPLDAPMNQYTATPSDERIYDDNGNLIQRNAPGGSPTIARITYDYRNQMTEYVDVATDQRHEYVYDALGRRIAKVVDADGVASGSIETHYLYGGQGFEQVIEEQNENNSTLATYVYGNYIDEVVQMRRGGDYYFHADDQFNTMAVTNSTGTVVERYGYGDFGVPEFLDASGVPLPAQQSAIGNSLLFTGRRYDAETGLYWYRTRYYDPVGGRFTSRDTIGIWGDPAEFGNGYSYVGNNPWTFLDPFGLCEVAGGSRSRDGIYKTIIEAIDKALQSDELTPKQRRELRDQRRLLQLLQRERKRGLTTAEEAELLALQRKTLLRNFLRNLKNLADGTMTVYEIVEGVTIEVTKLAVSLLIPGPGDDILVAMALFGKLEKGGSPPKKLLAQPGSQPLVRQ